MKLTNKLLSKTLALLLALGLTLGAHAGELVVYAASSTTDALSEVAAAYEKASGNEVHFSFASSSTLAKQIMAGAPADIYVSANVGWMDKVEAKGVILNDSRHSFVANQLVLIAPVASKLQPLEITKGFALAKLLGDGRLALANPEHVPAGIYAKASLESLGVWESVKDRLVRGSNVRVTLNYVANGGIPLGIVYGTDAAVADKVKQLGVFPADSHPPIVYTTALTKQVTADDQAARDFFAFMSSDVADAIMADYGFRVLD